MEQQYDSEEDEEEQYLKIQNDNFFPDLMALKNNTVFDTDCVIPI